MHFTKCVRIDSGDFVSEAGLLQKGFREIEELVTWERTPTVYPYESPMGVRKARLKDVYRCMKIANVTFSHHRRHRDGKFPDWLADLSKMWTIGGGFFKPSQTIFVADRVGVAGFLLAVRELFGVRIDLIAVDPLFRRRGIAENLIFKAMDHYARDGCPYIVAGTQAHNIASCKLYESLGFVIGRRQRTFHK